MHKRNIDVVLLVIVLMLTTIGLLMVYSASNVVALKKYSDSHFYFKRQLLFGLIGIAILFLFIKVDMLKYKKYVSLVFLVCLLLLVLVLVPGIGSKRGGARSWISIFGFSIQPSEFMKLGLTGLYAKYLSSHYKDLKSFKSFLMLFGFAGLIFLLIMLQPDFGTGLVIMLSIVVLIYIGGVRISYFIILLVIGLVGIGVLIASAPYRLERITAFINPWNDPLGSGFQGIQSLYAITPGGFFGHGFNNSMQKHFFLPEPQNDFIFAILLEEFGLIGGILVLLLYFVTFLRGIKISMSVDNLFLKFFSFGLIISIIIQVVVNISVVVGLLPVTGITLPLFSYGGSSLLLTLASFGMLISISKYQNYDYR